MSATSTLLPVAKALVETEKAIGAGEQWTPVNAEQRAFLEMHLSELRPHLDQIPELTASVSTEKMDNNLVAVDATSVLDVTVQWVKVGDERTIVQSRTMKEFPGVRLAHEHIAIYTTKVHPYPIAILETKSGDRVFITQAPHPLRGTVLDAYVRTLTHTEEITAVYFGFDGVQFPMVKLDDAPNIDWLEKMSTTSAENYPAIIASAKQTTKLRVNVVGAHVKSEVHIRTMVFGSAHAPKPPDLIIDEPFLLWFTRPGIPVPLAICYVTEEHWVNPGSLKID
ncbi:MAG: hypothetical protein WCV85_05820 [Patescibacteria group bacterium]|jgi:hypothetical protein